MPKAHRTGIGAQTLSEQRAAAKAERQAEEKESLTFSIFFNDTYFPLAKADKVKGTIIRERSLFTQWLEPAIGNTPLLKISPLDLERLKKTMTEAGQSPRSVCYALAIVRQVLNRAKNIGMYEGDNPVSRVRKPSKDNRRTRFLTHAEADRLLSALLDSGHEDLYAMTLLSLHCGLRAGEIFNLSWDCIDFERKTILIRDTKSNHNRVAYMTGPVKEMLARRQVEANGGLLFSKPGGGKIGQVGHTFIWTVEQIGLNKGVTDRRDKVVFHTLRHTFASWLIMSGEDIKTVSKLVGHTNIQITSDYYSHFSNEYLREKINKIGQILPLGDETAEDKIKPFKKACDL